MDAGSERAVVHEQMAVRGAEVQDVDSEDRAPSGVQGFFRADLRVLDPDVRKRASVDTPTSNSTTLQPATTKSTDRGARLAMPTTAKSSAARMMTAGGPSRVINGTATRQPRPAPTRSAKYTRPTASPARPSSTETMIPNEMNVANNAKQMTARSTRFLTDARVP